MKSATRAATASCLLATLAGCASTTPMPTVQRVDLERFMGDWYVIASTPTSIEKGAHNAVESYRLDPSLSASASRFSRQQDRPGRRQSAGLAGSRQPRDPT